MLRIFLTTTSLLLCFLFPVHSFAQKITGQVFDAEKQKPMQYVEIYNIYSQEVAYSDSLGNFEIGAKKGELIEFKMLGYKVTRIRLHTDPANYYKIGMIIGPIDLDELSVYERNKSGRLDSLHTAEVFKRAIEMQRLEGLDAIRHPITALSKEYRRTVAFQKRYEKTEREKYLTFIFNDNLIQQLTKLGKDSLADFKSVYTPSFEELTFWNEYEFYTYIKESVAAFRRNSLYYQRQNQINE